LLWRFAKVSQPRATKSSKAHIVSALANNPTNSRKKERYMKELIALFILASLISRTGEPGQAEENEIRLLIARAPVVPAMGGADGAGALAVWHWLMALAYTGHAEEAFAAAAKIRKWMRNDEAKEAIALGLAAAGKVDEALSLSRGIKDPSFHGLSITILSKAGRFSEALNEARKMEEGAERDEKFRQIAEELAMRGEIDRALESEVSAIWLAETSLLT
jgi:tetratricopeptide (TPR) repeat protein